VKTHFIQDEGFSMPNLISIKRLNKLLQDDTNELAYIFVDYKRHDGKVMIENIIIKYIWELDWSILRIGALGKGQLQIKDANQQLKFTNIGRKKWIERLKNEAISFYETELNKTKKEIKFWKK
jgi:hypothetical protein